MGIEACERMLEKLAANSKGWSSGRDSSVRVAAASDLDPIDIISKQLVLMNQKMDDIRALNVDQPQGFVKDVNYIHQGGNQRNFNNYRPYQGCGHYQAGNRSHPNLSYRNPNNALQPPPRFSVSNGVIEEPKSSTTNDLIRALMVKTENYMAGSNKMIDKMEMAVVEMNTRMNSLETQISQISQAVGRQHQPGQFPGNTVGNPKDCKAIHLRSGATYESSPLPEERT